MEASRRTTESIPIEKRIDAPKNRGGLLEHFADDEPVQMSIATDLALPDAYD